MVTLNPVHILFPIVAMVALVVFVVVRIARSRIRAVRRRDISVGFYKLYQGSEEPDELRALRRHFANLFELPILFYVACIVAYVSVQVDIFLVLLAWLFVVSRYVHSYIHLTSNIVIYRFRVYGIGLAVLVLMWLTLTIHLVKLVL
ncbi:MAG: MAPEG family protein [Nitrosomonadaceae bacterium]|jgi:hypothetical protein|nr:MAPEG family protein [Pseudomonadota bacterium]MCH8976203.1 MAPEG family protein [Pseudomonadota bacterium]